MHLTNKLFSLVILYAAAIEKGCAFSHEGKSCPLRQQPISTECSVSNVLNVESSQRRSLLWNGVCAPFLMAATAATISSTPAVASEVRGPVELLRPATRVKLYVDQAIAICQAIQAADKEKIDEESIKPIQEYLLGREPSFMTPEEERLSRRYLEIDTSTAWESRRLKEREARGAELGIDYTTPYDRFNTVVQQFGDKQTFQILRQRQRGLEKNNAMRAAFNAYTNNLVFGDAYQLNVQGEAKKALVRNDALPDVNAVVVSDLDLRDLYRNQILQNIDDAKAEVAYQLKAGEFDMDEILNYLVKAKNACDDWFGFIPKADVEEALVAVQSEKLI